jgi:hypothetical protein
MPPHPFPGFLIVARAGLPPMLSMPCEVAADIDLADPESESVQPDGTKSCATGSGPSMWPTTTFSGTWNRQSRRTPKHARKGGTSRETGHAGKISSVFAVPCIAPFHICYIGFVTVQRDREPTPTETRRSRGWGIARISAVLFTNCPHLRGTRHGRPERHVRLS